MASLHKIAPPLAGHIDHAGLATRFQGPLTPTNEFVGRKAFLLALGELRTLPAGIPPDGEFAQLLSQAVADLLLPGNEAKLESILRYHAIASQVHARQSTRTHRRVFPSASQAT